MPSVRTCVVPVDTRKHRECSLSTLKTGTCSLSTLKPGTLPEQVQKSAERGACQVERDRAQARCNNMDKISETLGAGRLGACGGSGVQACIYCRRKAYAQACVGVHVVLTRWQEWCVPFLSSCRRDSAASIMALVEAHIKGFVGATTCFQQRALCRTAAGYQVGIKYCKCLKQEEMQRQSETLTMPYCSLSDRNCNKKMCMEEKRRPAENKVHECMLGGCNIWMEEKRCPVEKKLHEGVLGGFTNTNMYHLTYKYHPCQRVGRIRRKLARYRRDTKYQDLQQIRFAGPRGKRVCNVSKDSFHLSGRTSAKAVSCRKSIARVVSCRRRSAIGTSWKHYEEARNTRSGRLQGGGVEKLTCFVCLACKDAYISPYLSEEYVARCCTCGRGACREHGEWEVGKFHCILCHGNRDQLIASTKDTLAMRCVSKAFQQQQLLHSKECAFEDLTLTMLSCWEQVKDQELADNKPQTELLSEEDALQLVKAMMLSHLGSAESVRAVLTLDWVGTWEGWSEVKAKPTEAVCQEVSQRLCQLAEINVQHECSTDRRQLQALQAQGFVWQVAHSHGANNCLIDALVLCLCDKHMLPSSLKSAPAGRRLLAAKCRQHLVHHIGAAEVGPNAAGMFPYLDAHRDVPCILGFLYRHFGISRNRCLEITVHDRFGLSTVDPDRNRILVQLGDGQREEETLQLDLYNHTTSQGRGYHFDALFRKERDQERRKREKNQDRDKVEQERQSAMPVLDSTRDDSATAKDQNAETVFAKMGWYLHGACKHSRYASWLEAILLNLAFHDFICARLGLPVAAGERARLCEACQQSLAQTRMHAKRNEKTKDADQTTLDIEQNLDAALTFLTTRTQDAFKVEIHIYEADRIDLSEPRKVYVAGTADTVIVSIFRLYCNVCGEYSALLPFPAASFHQANDSMQPQPGWSSYSGTELEKLRECLQRFCEQRGATVEISEADAQRLHAAWWNLDETGVILHTILQAGLVFADAGMHHARRLAEQWRGFFTCYTQGPGRKLGANRSNEAADKKPNCSSASNAVDQKKPEERSGTKRIQRPGEQEESQEERSTKRAKVAGHEKQASSNAEQVPLPRRVRKKTSPDAAVEAVARSAPPVLEEEVHTLRVWTWSQGNRDPRAVRDVELQDAAKLLSSNPTIPERLHSPVRDNTKAYDMPDFHCAFAGCSFECTTQDHLEQHISQTHRAALQTVARPWCQHLSAPQALFQAYQEVLTRRCQQLAPAANCSLDRRSLRRLRESMRGRRIGAAICFVCARKFPFMANFPNQQITWIQAYDSRTGLVLGQEADRLETLLGASTYHSRFVASLPEATQASLKPELEPWRCDIVCPNYFVTVLACPEDKVCVRRCALNRLCTHCEIPVCTSCCSYIYRKSARPPEALSNDMFIGHPPQELYTQECTVLELLCASPCMTALTCFSIEWRYLQDRSLAQDAFMNRHRLCAKGNATTFPLPWEDLLSEFDRLGYDTDQSWSRQLPHVGKDLIDKVAVIIKVGKKQDTEAAVRQHVIHQAVVRRKVVVSLIRAMLARGHPAYNGIDMATVVNRAEMLPENDVPSEILALLENDDTLSCILRQKAATPINDQMTIEQAHREFAHMLKPNAVVLEKTSAGDQDMNAKHVAALEDVVARSQAGPGQPLPEVSLYTGTKLLDQFQPLYFALAFPFVFPYGIGMPDVPKWSKRARLRRQAEDPYLELNTWVRVMARRIEAQVSRDWVFGFTSWNLLFRSALNLSHTTNAYSRTYYDEDAQEWVQPTGRHVEAAAQQLLAALTGSYVDVNGQVRLVKGDVSKLQYVPGLKPMARKLLQNMRHTAQGLPGTQEARKRMRYEIQAMRIRYGVPLFVTFTPDESHQLLFIRMVRVRESDPVRDVSIAQDYPAGSMYYPDLTGPADHAQPFEYEFALPMSWAERREVLARDPLAAVDGFRVLTQLVLKHLFGVRVCPSCPDCNCFCGLQPCQDYCGSNAEPVGGIFGRVDAVYMSLEAQKSTGSMHGHLQIFVQCLHQHTSLEEIFGYSSAHLDALRTDYESYNAHVCHASYAGQSPRQMEPRIAAAEGTWPAHELDTAMTTLPQYQLDRCAANENVETEAAEWYKQYLEQDVVQLQLLKQHHYHPYNEVMETRVPLAGCQKSDRPGICKSEFPRTEWLCPQATVLCPCKLKAFGMPAGSRKNRLGALHGPCGNEWLNGCAPAMLAGIRGANCDVQVPYRLPYACPTCGEQLTQKERQLISLAAQRAQDAQTGYCADYCSKSQPMGHGEIREFQKGHQQLHIQHAKKPVEDIGKRHANRFLSDAYLKGVVRGQVECANLRANHREATVVSAERIATTSFETFPGAAFANFVTQCTGEGENNLSGRRTSVKWTPRQGSGARHLGNVDIVQVYGHRPQSSEVWWLSPYEFTAKWAVTLARVPTTRREWEREERGSWDVSLTAAGLKQLEHQTDLDKKIALQPKIHYHLAVQSGSDRIALDETSATTHLRHRCFLQRRRRPLCPHFEYAPVPRQKNGEAEGNARLTIAYFRAWTLNAPMASANVPFVGHLKPEGETWTQVLRTWLTHLPCEETKRYVGNFLSVYRSRATDTAEANSDDSGVDEPLLVTPSTLQTALQTSFRQTGKQRKEHGGDPESHAENKLLATYEEAATQADATWKHHAEHNKEQELNRKEIQFFTQDPLATRSALKTLRKKLPTSKGQVLQDPVPSSLAANARLTIEKIDQFLLELREKKRCNPEQHAFVQTVATRIKEEAASGQDRGGKADINTEPLRWALHGGPGTGKS